MTDVLSLFGAEKPAETDLTDGPHIVGPCRCGACDHEWVGTAPVGQTHIECPKCKRDWGIFLHAIEPSGPTWRCTCGNTLFWLTPTGAMCRGCGLRSNDWAD